MLGRKSDILGYETQQMNQLAAPGNRFLNDYLLLKPILGAPNTLNRRERLISQRNTTLALANSAQGIQVRVYRENEKMTPTGGLAALPAGGLLGRLFSGKD